ncbi:MAG TPA: glycerophosphodiester phosphodiesterase family protein [bacterium]|jgi:glycerophosphoryl diester phosphodiesterase|nr:hypothetical protein [Myxococcales bacterium]OQA61859.1 MAG: Glycerophosphoryl diester phosphodiesterase [bacterium ADurb.Bin270]HPW45660.1 glycerophosphodiester phosphodiesterase family protein [bacterium]
MSKKPLIIAHRGACREAPENTIPAISRAVELGADAIEIDVMLTSDDVPVVTHNEDLSILTGCKKNVGDITFREIRELDFGIHFSDKFAGTKIPTLEEVLSEIRYKNIDLIVEIKIQSGKISKAARVIGDILQNSEMADRITASSFSVRMLYELSWSYPKLRRAYVIAYPAFLFFIPKTFARLTHLSGIHGNIKTLSARAAKRVRQIGCPLYAWTVNTCDEIEKSISLEVDGIFTDDLLFVTEYIGGKRDGT